MVRNLNPVDHNLKRITKADKYFAKRLAFKDIKFPVKIRDIHKIKKIKILLALASLLVKTKHNIQSMYQKNVVKINMFMYYW